MPMSVQKLAARLSFRQLQVFLAVYEQKNYSKAGELLGLTQPAVSSQIRLLEDTLATTLFEYVGRRLFVTAAGEMLANSVNTIFNELRFLQNELAALNGEVAGDLKLVAVNTAQYVVPYLLKEFLDQHSNINVHVSVVNRAAALQRLNDNRDDLVIMGLVPTEKPFASLPFLDNELVPVVSASHPLLQVTQPIPAQQFLNSQLLMREAGSGSRLALEVHCQQQRMSLSPRLELGSNDAVKHAVLAGLGVAVLPKLSIIPELQLGSLRILDVEGFPLRRSWCVVYPQAKHPTPAMRAFLDYIQSNVARFEQMFGISTSSQ